MHRFQNLPRSCFVPFPVFPVEAPVAVWTNEGFLGSFDVFRHAFIASSHTGCSAGATYALAERYGGDGLGRNGGGARCGVVAGIQIKGVGRNPLASRGTDYYHSYGGASLKEAALDAIWGEVAEVALPHGGVRCLGVVATGTNVPVKYPSTQESDVAPRAIYFRKPALRMGHLLRAAYFDSETGYIEGGIADNIRTQATIRWWLDPSQQSSVEGVLSPAKADRIEIASTRIKECLLKHAAQLAAARVKRLMHGSLTGSNICLDGRWIDFVSSSAISDFGPVVIPRGSPDFLHEEDLIFRALNQLMFYVNKYADLGIDVGAEVRSVWKVFLTRFRECLELEFLKLFGIEFSEISAIPTSIRTSLYSSMQEVNHQGAGHPFSILSVDPEHIPEMPERFGTNKLNEAIAAASLARSSDELEQLVGPAIPHEQTRRVFLSNVSLLDSWLNEKQGRSPTRLFKTLCRNAPLQFLYRTDLHPRIVARYQDPASMSNLISEVVGNANLLLGEAALHVANVNRRPTLDDTRALLMSLYPDYLRSSISDEKLWRSL
jgi:hypothetical protein